MTDKSIAVLSNVNMNPLIRTLEKDFSVYQPEGYGNELGILLNPGSSYYAFGPEITFLIMDLGELLEHDMDRQAAGEKIANWFRTLEGCLSPETVYYISDAWYFGPESEMTAATGQKEALEALWRENLEHLCAQNSRVRCLPYRQMIAGLGVDSAFSMKMWYMGKILLSGEATRRLADILRHKVELESRTPKKVLLLDLDNTLWGGLAGEQEHTPVVLSDDHGGLAYKNLQRIIKQMQLQGVLLGIVSKNNPEDAMKIIEEHPHMVLRREDFAAVRINWLPKNENIVSIAEELNLGVDSFVFWDDNPQERLLVQQLVPQVTVPDFPSKPEELAPCMLQIFRDYFEKAVLTGEDYEKTKQYADNAKRKALENRVLGQAGSFADYLKSLDIRVIREQPQNHLNRMCELLNKTNQFNLTTVRHSIQEVQKLVETKEKEIFLYRVQDCFGDYGVVAVVIAAVYGREAVLEEFVMSCRVMGKNIEAGILSDVEQSLMQKGCEKVWGCFVPTAKNSPVAKLYPGQGYQEPENQGSEPKNQGSEPEKMVSELQNQGSEPEKVWFVRDLRQPAEREFVGSIVGKEE